MAFSLIIPHSDGAGEVEKVGPGLVHHKVGQRVWIWNGQWGRPFGTAAEFIVVPSAQAVPLPDNIDYTVGACLGIPALTAWQAVHLAAISSDSTVLIHGGAGSVAQIAIQLAKLKGARILTTVDGADKAAKAQAAGASEIIEIDLKNYRTENMVNRVKELTHGHGVDAIIEVNFAANAILIPGLLRPHGTAVVYGITGSDVSIQARWMVRNSTTLRFFLVYDLNQEDRATAIKEITELLRTSRLTHTIGARSPLDQIVRAHESVGTGKVVGNVVVDLPFE